MGQIPCVDSLSDTRSCGGPLALGQQAQLLPCLPARRLASWRPPLPKPWGPALKTKYLPLVRANTSSVPTIHIPGDDACETTKNLHIVSILHPDAEDAKVPVERQSSKGIGSPSRHNDDSGFMTPSSHSGGTVEEGSKSSARLPEVGPSCTHCKQSNDTRSFDSLTNLFFLGEE